MLYQEAGTSCVAKTGVAVEDMKAAVEAAAASGVLPTGGDEKGGAKEVEEKEEGTGDDDDTPPREFRLETRLRAKRKSPHALDATKKIAFVGFKLACLMFPIVPRSLSCHPFLQPT